MMKWCAGEPSHNFLISPSYHHHHLIISSWYHNHHLIIIIILSSHHSIIIIIILSSHWCAGEPSQPSHSGGALSSCCGRPHHLLVFDHHSHADDFDYDDDDKDHVHCSSWRPLWWLWLWWHRWEKDMFIGNWSRSWWFCSIWSFMFAFSILLSPS